MKLKTEAGERQERQDMKWNRRKTTWERNRLQNFTTLDINMQNPENKDLI